MKFIYLATCQEISTILKILHCCRNTRTKFPWKITRVTKNHAAIKESIGSYKSVIFTLVLALNNFCYYPNYVKQAILLLAGLSFTPGRVYITTWQRFHVLVRSGIHEPRDFLQTLDRPALQSTGARFEYRLN